MRNLNMAKFKETCAYCYMNIYNLNGIQVCVCGLTLCTKHSTIHLQKSKNHACLYHVVFDNELVITGEDITDKEKEIIKERITKILESSDKEEDIALEYSKIDCSHIKEATKSGIGPKASSCLDCTIVKNVWVCLQCGFVGCSRIQYGQEGNGHAMKHYEHTKHPVFVKLDSVMSDGSAQAFCYICDEYVSNQINEDLILKLLKQKEKHILSLPKQKEEKPSNLTQQKESPYLLKDTGFLGINNSGNTCYISSVIQLLGNCVISDETFQFENHFLICTEDVSNCFACQLMRIFQAFKDRKKLKKDVKGISNPISIFEFNRILEIEAPQFKRGQQQDAGEFLIYILNRIKLSENLGEIASISNLFDLELEIEFSCDTCKESTRCYEQNTGLNIIFKNSVKESLEEFFSEVISTCECGGIRRKKTSVRIPPAYLLLTLSRWKIGDKIEKIVSPIHVDNEISLEIKEFTVDEKSITNLQNLGFSKEQARRALIRSKGDIVEASNILYYTQNTFIRETGNYQFIGSVCHKGENFNSGHYLFWTDNKVINDVNVYSDKEYPDLLGLSYIICYK